MADGALPTSIASSVETIANQPGWLGAACVILGAGIVGLFFLYRLDIARRDKSKEELYDRYLADIKLAGEQVARAVDALERQGRAPPRTRG